MHEWALAEAVVETVEKLASKEGAEAIREVVVRVGELQQIDLEVFEFALKTLVKNTIVEKAAIKIEVEEAVLKCGVCGFEWKYKDALSSLEEEVVEAIHFVPEVAHAYIKCPNCGSSDFKVVQGRGVYLERVVFNGES